MSVPPFRLDCQCVQRFDRGLASTDFRAWIWNPSGLTAYIICNDNRIPELRRLKSTKRNRERLFISAQLTFGKMGE
jgi:hypothetical protein